MVTKKNLLFFGECPCAGDITQPPIRDDAFGAFYNQYFPAVFEANPAAIEQSGLHGQKSANPGGLCWLMATGATRPDGGRITTFYDPKTTKVTSFIDRQGEMESYTVLQGAPDQKKVMLKRTKNGKKVYDMTYSYQYNAQGLPTNEKVMKRDEGGEWIDSESTFLSGSAFVLANRQPVRNRCRENDR